MFNCQINFFFFFGGKYYDPESNHRAERQPSGLPIKPRSVFTTRSKPGRVRKVALVRGGGCHRGEPLVKKKMISLLTLSLSSHHQPLFHVASSRCEAEKKGSIVPPVSSLVCRRGSRRVMLTQLCSLNAIVTKFHLVFTGAHTGVWFGGGGGGRGGG